jgi:hypothetical protein
MSSVVILNVIATNSRSNFRAPVGFDIFFEVLEPLKHSIVYFSHNDKFADLTWRIIYIGQASNTAYDQLLEEAEMEGLQPGQMKFLLEVLSLYLLSYRQIDNPILNRAPDLILLY